MFLISAFFLFPSAFQNRSMAAQEKKLMRDTSVLHENEKRSLNDQMKKNSKMDKDRMKKVSQWCPHAVSYTHLTLPTMAVV